MADVKLEETPTGEGFSSQNQPDDEASLGNDDADNVESPTGSFRHREDGGEDEGDSQVQADDQSHQMETLLAVHSGQTLQQITLVDGQIPTQPIAVGYGHICNDCGAWYKLRQSLNSHIQDHHQGKRFKCAKCTYSTNRRHDLFRHDSQVHRIGKSGTPRRRNLSPKGSTVAAALKKSRKSYFPLKLLKKPEEDEEEVVVNSSNVVMLQSDPIPSIAQPLIVVSDGMQGAVFSGSSPAPVQKNANWSPTLSQRNTNGSPTPSPMNAGWIEDNNDSQPHRQTESFEHQLPSGAIFRRITEITFFPDGRIRETRTEEYEMP